MTKEIIKRFSEETNYWCTCVVIILLLLFLHTLYMSSANPTKWSR